MSKNAVFSSNPSVASSNTEGRREMAKMAREVPSSFEPAVQANLWLKFLPLWRFLPKLKKYKCKGNTLWTLVLPTKSCINSTLDFVKYKFE